MAQTEGETSRKRKKARTEPVRGETCLNCEAGISTRFCPECGQENRPPELTLHAVLREFLAEIAYYDSKMWRTIRTLVANPGRLSNEWSLGRRATYLSPVRLYLTVTFLFFLVTAWRSTPSMVSINVPPSKAGIQEMIREISKEKITPLERQLLENQEPSLKLTAEQAKAYTEAVDQASKNEEAASRGASAPGQASGFKGWLVRQVTKMEESDPKVLSREIIAQIPKVLFIILPIFAVVLRVLYVRMKRTFVEHLVFILHFHSFAFLALLPSVLISGPATSVVTGLMVVFGLPAYAFVAMLRFYGQKWWVTLLKSWFLGLSYVFLLMIGASLAVFIAAASLPEPPSGGAHHFQSKLFDPAKTSPAK